MVERPITCGAETGGRRPAPTTVNHRPLSLAYLWRAWAVLTQDFFAVGSHEVRRLLIVCGLLLGAGFGRADRILAQTSDTPYLIVLGVAQDGGYPQTGCPRECCARAWRDPTQARNVVSLGLVDPLSGERWLFECTPDFKSQLRELDRRAPVKSGLGLNGIVLTHAHIGHYAGLLHLGREVLGAQNIPVLTMPRMHHFLRANAPWSQLVELQNIELRELAADQCLALNSRLSITPLIVPHRDEFSETVAYRIKGPNRQVLFLPDIDKWDRWERTIERELEQVDVAFLDATFFDGDELPGRDLREIPHPFVVESLQRFSKLGSAARGKIHLIHFNHSNPLLDPSSDAVRQTLAAGLRLAEQGDVLGL